MNYVLETPRFRLRELDPSDANQVFRLNQHPDILRFTTDPPFDSVEAAREFLAKYQPYADWGYGRWAVEDKVTGDFIGWCGLKFHPEENETDIGYRLLPEYWGKGIAVETASACCRWGFEVMHLKRIVARVHKQNVRSIRVSEKMGMVYEKDLDYDGVPWLNYIVPREAVSRAEAVFLPYQKFQPRP